MANVEHSALTGSNLHESKGVSTAASNTIYVADGVGSGSWTTAGASSIATAVKVFQAQLLHIRDQKANSVNGATLTEDTWTDRELQTVNTNEIASASLGSNTISLPAGTYFLMGWVTANGGGVNRTVSIMHRLRNTSDNTTLVWSGNSGSKHTGINADHLTGSTPSGQIVGRFTLSGTKNIKLQTFVGVSGGASAWGVNAGYAASSGEPEVYADILIWKIA